MNIETYNAYINLNSQIMSVMFSYFNDVICKNDTNEELEYLDVWFRPNEIIIHYENVETEKTYTHRLPLNDFIKYSLDNKIVQ